MTTATLTETMLEPSLRDLRTAAPPSVGFGALVEAGLADRYAAIDTPLGQAFVAWNGRGVSWVGKALDGGAIARKFGEEVGRPIEPAEALPERLATCAATPRSRSWSG